MLNSEITYEILAQRKHDLENNWKFSDNYKVAIFAPGGGQRGCYQAGALEFLLQAKLGNCFDMAIGISAGAINLAYFLANQAEIGKTIYFEENCLEKWFDAKRAVPLNMDFTYHTIFQSYKRIDEQAILNSQTKFYALAIKESFDQTVIIDLQESNPVLEQGIKASSAVPGFYGKKINVKNQMLCDVAMINNLCLRQICAELHPTHVLILENDSLRGIKSHQITSYHQYFQREGNVFMEKMSLRDKTEGEEERFAINSKETIFTCWEVPNNVPVVETFTQKATEILAAEEICRLSMEKTFYLNKLNQKPSIV